MNVIQTHGKNSANNQCQPVALGWPLARHQLLRLDRASIWPGEAARHLLLDGFVRLGIAREVTQRAKRRLYGLIYLAPLRAAAAPPRRPMPDRRPGRPGAAAVATAVDPDAGPTDIASLLAPPLPSRRWRGPPSSSPSSTSGSTSPIRRSAACSGFPNSTKERRQLPRGRSSVRYFEPGPGSPGYVRVRDRSDHRSRDRFWPLPP